MQLVIAIIPRAGHAGSQVGYFFKIVPCRKSSRGLYFRCFCEYFQCTKFIHCAQCISTAIGLSKLNICQPQGFIQVGGGEFLLIPSKVHVAMSST